MPEKENLKAPIR